MALSANLPDKTYPWRSASETPTQAILDATTGGVTSGMTYSEGRSPIVDHPEGKVAARRQEKRGSGRTAMRTRNGIVTSPRGSCQARLRMPETSHRTVGRSFQNIK